MLRTGIIGAAIAAICCFTPLLVVVLAAIGATAAVAWLDFVLLPALAFFLCLIGVALWRRRRSA